MCKYKENVINICQDLRKYFYVLSLFQRINKARTFSGGKRLMESEQIYKNNI